MAWESCMFLPQHADMYYESIVLYWYVLFYKI